MDVIGDGYLRDAARSLHAPGVTVHGFVPESIKGAFLARSDLLLLPGTREGWGIVGIEAGLNGVPTIAYDVPGLRDAIIDGSTGTLTRCTPEALGEAAVDLLRDPETWLNYSEASRRRAILFTWQRAADDLLALLPTGVSREATQNAA
jgi:glycosyltransferase involved in cell wall biosynthesis